MSEIEWDDDDEFVSRPRDQLLNYPVDVRWEVTRRHPYYLGLWQKVLRYHANPAATVIDANDLIGLAAKLALNAIGVGGVPVSPETSFDQISGEDPTFLCGSLQPMTIRSIAPLLFCQLAPDCQQFLAKALFAYATSVQDPTLSDKARKANLMAWLDHVLRHPHPDLDKVPNTPLFFMHLDASQESIKEDAIRQARLWKARMGKGSAKVHTAKFPNYLAVWDHVEGWTGGGYEPDREQSVKSLRTVTKKSSSTLHGHFRAAFRSIIGQDFSPALWWRTMGRMKLALLSGRLEQSSLWLARRRFARHQDRLVAATTLAIDQPPDASAGPIHDAKAEDGAADLLDLVTDIEELISRGKTDKQIVAALNLVRPESRRMLKFVRRKNIDLKAFVA